MNDLINRLADQLGVDRDIAETLTLAAEPLWDALESLGWVDSFGGAECRRVLPQAISFIHRTANQGPVPAEWN